MDVQGRIHGSHPIQLQAALDAVNALPGVEAVAEDVPEGWSVRYICRGITSAEESWEVPARALAAFRAAK